MSPRAPRERECPEGEVVPYRPPELEGASDGHSPPGRRFRPMPSTEAEITAERFVPLGRTLAPDAAGTRREEAEAVLREAKRRASDVEQEAYRLGFEQGERAGMQLADEKLTPLLEGLVRLTGELQLLRERVYREVEREIVELACAVAEKVINVEVGANREVVLKGVQAALKGMADREEVRIRVNVADLAFLRQHKGDLMKAVDGLSRAAIEEDPSVGRGCYIVETPEGNLNGCLEEQLDSIRQELLAHCPPVQQEPVADGEQAGGP